MVMKIILLASFLPILLIVFFVLRNEAKPKKNLILGVTLPHDQRGDPSVAAVVKKYLLLEDAVLAILLTMLIPPLFLHSDGSVMTWFLTWLIFALVLPWLPYGFGNKRLRELKSLNNWFAASSGVTLVDTKVAVAPRKMLSIWVFVPPFAMSLVPVVLTAVTLRGKDEHVPLLLVYALLAVFVAAFYFFYRFMYRQRAEVVDENTLRNATLTQVRRHNWGKCWLWTAYLTGLFAPALWLLQNEGLAVSVLSVVYSAVLIIVLLRAEFVTRRVQQKLSEESGRSLYTDDDDKWLLGVFYNNPNDSHYIVNRRTGIGTTMNFAKAPGKVLAVFVGLLLLSMPLIGVWIMRSESTPVRLEITDTQLVASHTGAVYKIDAGSVTALSLLDKLPKGTRTNGTALGTVLKGSFRLDGIGDCRLCLDPRTPPFLVIAAGGHTYILGSSETRETRAVYEALSDRGLIKAPEPPRYPDAQIAS